LWLLRYLEAMLPRETFRQMTLRMQGEGMTVAEARRYFAQYHLVLGAVTIDKNKLAQTASYTFILHSKHPEAFVQAFSDLLKRDDVQYGQLLSQEQQESGSATAEHM
jgi:hypothetical protein